MVIPIKKDTGFRCYREKLYVGDILSVYGGNCGFVRVVERDDGFWLEDWEKGTTEYSGNSDEKLTAHLFSPYQKVDPNDPYAEPPLPLYCDNCEETLVGIMDVETGEIAWLEECAEHYEESVTETVGFGTPVNRTYLHCLCNTCKENPTRISKTKELRMYLEERLQEIPFKTIHHSIFDSKEEIDDYIEDMKAASQIHEKFFNWLEKNGKI